VIWFCEELYEYYFFLSSVITSLTWHTNPFVFASDTMIGTIRTPHFLMNTLLIIINLLWNSTKIGTTISRTSWILILKIWTKLQLKDLIVMSLSYVRTAQSSLLRFYDQAFSIVFLVYIIWSEWSASCSGSLRSQDSRARSRTLALLIFWWRGNFPLAPSWIETRLYSPETRSKLIQLIWFN
jgi:hypothetical protein